MTAHTTDYVKQDKVLYLPPQTPVCLSVPKFSFIVIAGQGDPNGPEFEQVVGALYSLSYAVRMSGKASAAPTGYYEYKVFPLEGVWDLHDKGKPLTDKSNFRYLMMIRQPDFLTVEMYEEFLAATKKKKPSPFLERAVFETSEEGLCCQMLHVGSYDDEPQSFAKMTAYCEANGYRRLSLTHREIYLSDPRKTEAAKLKTVLRFKVEKG